MIDLNVIAKEIREILENKRKEYELTFKEEGHEYKMLDKNGILRNDFPSVSSVIDEFYTGFDAEEKSLQMSKGDVEAQKILLESWEKAGEYATNKGSRAHYELEKYALKKFGINKRVRKPIFECDEQQMIDSNNMIKAGKSFIDLMKDRGCVLIDTEIVLGSPIFGFVGQGDNFWLSLNKNKDNFGLIITDHKTNKVKNLIIQAYNTDSLYYPFENWISYALTHYYIQLPLYAKLFLDMMIGSKYENIPLLGCVIDSLRDNGECVEYKVPKEFQDKLLNMDLSPYVKTKKKDEKNYD